MRTHILLFFIFLIQYSSACTCKGKSTVEGGFKSSYAVFSGQVISTSYSTNYDSLKVFLSDSSLSAYDYTDFPVFVVKVKIMKKYKGNFLSDTITILTNPTGASCGYSFRKGKQYIIYANNKDMTLKRVSHDKNILWTNLCSRTMLRNQQEENMLKEMSPECND